MNFEELREITDSIRYKDWCLVITDQHAQLSGNVIYWSWRATCVNTGMPSWQMSAAWGVPKDVTEEGLVRLAFAAAQRAEMHECAEFFNYKGERVFAPHRSVL